MELEELTAEEKEYLSRGANLKPNNAPQFEDLTDDEMKLVSEQAVNPLSSVLKNYDNLKGDLGAISQGMLKGITAAPNLIDLFGQVGAYPIRKITGYDLLDGKQLNLGSKLYNAVRPDVESFEPKTIGGKIGETAAEFVGAGLGSGLLARGIQGVQGVPETAKQVSKILGSATSSAPKEIIRDAVAGIGARGAQEITGDKTIAPIIGAMAAPIGMGVVSGVRRASNVDDVASDILQSQVTAPQKEAQALRDSIAKLDLSDALDQAKTSAEVGKSAGLSTLQRTLEGLPEGVPLRELPIARKGLRNDVISKYIQDVPDPSVTGKALRDAIVGRKEHFETLVKKAYEPLNKIKGNFIPAAKVKNNLADTLANYIYEPTGNVKTLVDKIQSLPLRSTYKEMETIRRTAASIGSDLSSGAAPDKVGASVAMSIADAVEEAYTKAAQRGTIPKDAINKMNKARELRALQGRIFESGAVGDALEKEAYGRSRVLDSDVLKTLYDGKPETVRQVLTALPKEQRDLYRRASLENIVEKSTTANGSLSLNFAKTLKKQNEALGKLLSEKELARFQKVANDILSEESVKAMSQPRGSDTFKNFTVAEHITNQISNALSGQGQTIGNILTKGVTATGVTAAKDRAIRNRLVQAALDPKVAELLLSKPTPDKLQTANELAARILRGSQTEK